MAQARRMFRVFVSSTFSDLKAERNALQANVFPRLRALCEEHNTRFQPIDLRWGVSEEASLDQQAMNICLGEIERCQQISPRPNFIVLLGDRYGWCPLPSQIPDNVFRQIEASISSKVDLDLVNEWYSLDENAIPAEWYLKPRRKNTTYEDYASWQKVEKQIHAVFERAVKSISLSEEERTLFLASATEQEIVRGALNVDNAADHVLCYFRKIEGFQDQFDKENFLRLVQTRVRNEYPQGFDSSCETIFSELQKDDHLSSAVDYEHWIQKIAEVTPKATPRKDCLDLINQILIDFSGKDFFNLNEDWKIDSIAYENQNRLKNRLRDHIPNNIYQYQAQWIVDKINHDHIEKLCEDVYSALSKVILREIKNPWQIRKLAEYKPLIHQDKFLDEEGIAHQKFAEERLKIFVGRKNILKEIKLYVQNKPKQILGIVGLGGTGKSSLLAKAIQKIQEDQPRSQIVFRFIGATPNSSDGRNLLDSLCREISRRYDQSDADIPIDYRDLVPELMNRMKLATHEKPLILLLDSLDQLSKRYEARNLIWLPSELPEHVSVVVTTRPEVTLDYLKKKINHILELKGLSEDEGDELLTLWLHDRKRDLQKNQKKAVLEKFTKSDGNPLYLRLAFEEAKLWKSSNSVPENLAVGIKAIIKENTIDRLKNESNHGAAMVSRALGYLAASRSGLAEDEMVDLLSRDLQVYEWFFKRSYHLPTDLVACAMTYRRDQGIEELRTAETENTAEKNAHAWLKEIRNPPEQVSEFLRTVLPTTNGPRLPIVLWSRLSFDLSPYLTETLVDGSLLLNFYHREFLEVAVQEYLTDNKDILYHDRLADYFRFKSDPIGDKSWSGNYIHGISELPYHLASAQRSDDLFTTLTDFKFLEQKAASVNVIETRDTEGKTVFSYQGVYSLISDFEFVLPEKQQITKSSLPIIVTPVDFGEGFIIRCPRCNSKHTLQREWIGNLILCPNPSCNGSLQINRFLATSQVYPNLKR